MKKRGILDGMLLFFAAGLRKRDCFIRLRSGFSPRCQDYSKQADAEQGSMPGSGVLMMKSC
jgi:hypothetical protein